MKVAFVLFAICATVSGFGGFERKRTKPPKSKCECTGSGDAWMGADATFPITDYHLVAEYGSSCRAWDSIDGTPWAAYCIGSEKEEIAVPDNCRRENNWCKLPWCYVDANCPSSRKTDVFAPADLYYSYNGCGAPDCYNDPDNHACPYDCAGGCAYGNQDAVILAATGNTIRCADLVDEPVPSAEAFKVVSNDEEARMATLSTYCSHGIGYTSEDGMTLETGMAFAAMCPESCANTLAANAGDKLLRCMEPDAGRGVDNDALVHLLFGEDVETCNQITVDVDGVYSDLGYLRGDVTFCGMKNENVETQVSEMAPLFAFVCSNSCAAAADHFAKREAAEQAKIELNAKLENAREQGIQQGLEDGIPEGVQLLIDHAIEQGRDEAEVFAMMCLDHPDAAWHYMDVDKEEIQWTNYCNADAAEGNKWSGVWAGDCEEENLITECANPPPSGEDGVRCEVGGWGPDKDGFYYSAARMAEIRAQCSYSCKSNGCSDEVVRGPRKLSTTSKINLSGKFQMFAK